MSIYDFVPQNSSLPLYAQLKAAIISDIDSGLLANMQKLPSRRVLARELAISTTTVNNAYQALVDEGYAMTIDRSGFYVKSGAPQIDGYDDITWEQNLDYVYNFSYNSSDLSSINMTEIRQFAKRLAGYNPEYLLSHGNKRGEPEFRAALCRYLSMHKQIECGINDVFLGAGVQYIFTVISMLLGKDKTYGFENPTDYKIYIWMKNLGLNIKLVNISDKAGFSCDELDKLGIDVMILAPENQLPTGICMSERKRRELARWCSGKNSGKYIIEYSTDGNLNYRKNREKSIYSLSGGRNVIYVDSFAPMISNNTKTAFMVLPSGIINTVIKKLEAYSPLVTIFEQLIYCELINSGSLTKLIKRKNKTMMQKRDHLIDCLMNSKIGSRLEITNSETGMNFLCRIDTKTPSNKLSRRALECGAKIWDLSYFILQPNAKLTENAFVFGYAGINENEIKNSVKCLETAWNDLI